MRFEKILPTLHLEVRFQFLKLDSRFVCAGTERKRFLVPLVDGLREGSKALIADENTKGSEK
jgi:hypothetical protein